MAWGSKRREREAIAEARRQEVVAERVRQREQFPTVSTEQFGRSGKFTHHYPDVGSLSAALVDVDRSPHGQLLVSGWASATYAGCVLGWRQGEVWIRGQVSIAGQRLNEAERAPDPQYLALLAREHELKLRTLLVATVYGMVNYNNYLCGPGRGNLDDAVQAVARSWGIGQHEIDNVVYFNGACTTHAAAQLRDGFIGSPNLSEFDQVVAHEQRNCKVAAERLNTTDLELLDELADIAIARDLEGQSII